MLQLIRRLVGVAAVLMIAGPAAAGSIAVSSNGTDSATCGSGANPPCATIAQAIANAADGDSILVGAGSYAGATVDKAVKLWSSSGNGGAAITSTVTITADGVVFGKNGKGFTIRPGSANTGIAVSANGVTVRGNLINDALTGIDATGNDEVVRDNTVTYCSTGVRIAGAAAQVRGNRCTMNTAKSILLDATSAGADVRENHVSGPSGSAFAIDGSGHVLRRNQVHGAPYAFTHSGTPTNVTLSENVVVGALSLAYNLGAGSGWVLEGNAAIKGSAPGFYLTAGTTFTLTGNIAIGNVAEGFYIGGGSDHVLVNNTAVDNGIGIRLGNMVGTGVQISGGNLYGNTSSNCGLITDAPNAVTAAKVYWGAAGGPGSDPADAICGTTAAMVTVTSPATKVATIKIPAVK